MNEIKIVKRDYMKVAGVTIETTLMKGQSKKEIPPFFHRTLDEKKLDDIPNTLNNNKFCVFEFTPNSPNFKYTMGVEVEAESTVNQTYSSLEFPSYDYATLEIVKRGHDDVKLGIDYILEHWLPESGYVLGDLPSFVYYDHRFFDIFNIQGYAGNPVATIYLPIKKKD